VQARLLNRVSCGPLRSANLLACARLFMSSLFADLSETCSSKTQVNPFPWKMVRLATGRGPWRLASSTSNPLEKASRFSQHSTPEPPLSIPPSLARVRERPAVSSPPQRCPGAAVLGNPRSFNLHSSAASRRYIPVAAPAAYSSSANLKLLPVQASIPDGCVGRLPHRRERLPL
jgi:hypothetical protein